ncbi:uncharacterized protein LOC116180768 [Photinus pyralis]|uniref:uncharacterized protein LOC116180768 n=1 Tax=Photinus pyralis TaxID=7054 RepID=UPI001266F7F6|nr:uncharacterized protein LOC116180768 [Photinus pyralis]
MRTNNAMVTWRTLRFLSLLSLSYAFGPKCRITFESATVDYVDERCMTARASIYDHNSTFKNVISVTNLFKIDLPDSFKMTFTTKKWVKNGYKITIMHIEKPLKSIIQWQLFGIQKFCMEHSRPPFTWPVAYQVSGITIDCSSYPPNLPDGRWLTVVGMAFANKTRVMEMSFKLLMEYV